MGDAKRGEGGNKRKHEHVAVLLSEPEACTVSRVVLGLLSVHACCACVRAYAWVEAFYFVSFSFLVEPTTAAGRYSCDESWGLCDV